MTLLAYFFSTTALILYSLSYFFNSKKRYLTLQLTGNVFLSVSYLVIGSYFTMVSVAIGIARGLLCYHYEKRDKSVPAYVIAGLCLATLASYVVINFLILSEASPFDALYLFASCMYAVTFAIRNLRVMRYAMLIPHSSAIAYNLLIRAPFSSAISYGIEWAVTVVAIFKFERQAYRQRKQEKENGDP